MAVAVVMEFEGGTLEQYEKIIEKMGYTRYGQGEPGGLFHWVAQTEDGLHIADVWETKEHFDNFAQEKLGPISQEVGAPAPSNVRVYDVHHYLTAGTPVAGAAA